jgi:hypothetical protein
MNQVSQDKKNTSGHAILELALVLPIFLATIFFGLEMGQLMKGSDITTALSRELALQVFRRCVNDYPTDSTLPPSDRLLPCVQTEIDLFRDQAGGIAPNAQLTVTLLRATPGGAIDNPIIIGSGETHGNITSPGQISNTMRSKFTHASINSDNSYVGRAIKEHKKLVLVEIFLPSNSLFPDFLGFYNIANIRESYAFTIL